MNIYTMNNPLFLTGTDCARALGMAHATFLRKIDYHRIPPDAFLRRGQEMTPVYKWERIAELKPVFYGKPFLDGAPSDEKSAVVPELIKS
jgi:hypothetical protein